MESSVRVNTSAIDAILQASFLVQLTLLTLIGLSVLCWAVAYLKHSQFKNLRMSNARFLRLFETSPSLDAIYDQIGKHLNSSLGRVFKAGYSELKTMADATQPPKEGTLLQLTGIDSIERTLRKAMDIEISEMEQKTTWLATTGSTGPFIGLFGTVWGIMSSFHKIGQMGTATLAVVAPGISEALIATAIGLAAAIPAVMLYNHFISEIKRQELELNNFSADFLNIVKRHFFKES